MKMYSKTANAIVAAALIFIIFEVAVISLAAIKPVQKTNTLNSIEFSQFESDLAERFGYEIIESLDSTNCMRKLWLAYNGEGWSDNYCYANYNHVLIKIK